LQAGIPPYQHHSTGFDYEERKSIAERLYKKCLGTAEHAGLTPAQHMYWCRHTVDMLFAFPAVALNASLARDDVPLDVVFEKQLRIRGTRGSEALANLIRRDPIVAGTTLHVAYNLGLEDSNLITGQRKNGNVSRGWHSSLLVHLGMTFEAIEKLKHTLNSR